MTDTIDGVEITAHGAALRNAGDGLSKALKLKDETLALGDEVTLLVKGRVLPPSFKPDKDNEDGVMRVDNIRVKSAQVVTGNSEIELLVKQHEEAVSEMLLREKEEREGLERIPFDPEEDKRQQAEDGVVVGDGSGEALPEYPEGHPRNPHGLRSITGDGEGDSEADEA